MAKRTCRSCGAGLEETFVDLGMSPVSNAFLTSDGLQSMEPFYPLHAYVCGGCFLVQLEEFESRENIFNDHYAYLSSYTSGWLRHCEAYARLMIERFRLGPASHVVEVASNDGYLLQYFSSAGIPVLGIEPTANTARIAESKGIPTVVKFLGAATARQIRGPGRGADLLVGNNVLAHVPDLNDFVEGLGILLAPGGVITMEFPHLLRLIRLNQFDTIYHEHFSYFSLLAARSAFARHGLAVFDVEELETHGGSLRLYVRRAGSGGEPVSSAVETLAAEEHEAGLDRIETYREFQATAEATKRDLLEFLIREKRNGRTIVGYGAPAKGNTLLNYCGIRADFLPFTVDLSPEKQGKFLPGTHIPVLAPEAIREARPDFVLILPWNIKEEIMEQMSHIREWGGRFVVPIPQVAVLP